MDQKVNVAGISIIINFVLTLVKIAAGTAMNSASVFASGVHSGLDLFAAILSYFSVNQTEKPADEAHRYGHGKYENVAAVCEALLILLAVVVIAYRSAPGVFRGGYAIHFPELGIAVMGASALVNFVVLAMLSNTYRRMASPALPSDYRHLLINTCASAVTCAGLIAVRYTGLAVIDRLLAFMVVLILLRDGYIHLRKSAGGIVDARLPEEEEKIIKEVLAAHEGKYVQYHALRTRRSGPDCHVDLHLVVPKDQVISLTHEICDSIERDLQEKLPGVNVLIHAEPCRPAGGECENCGIPSAECTAGGRVKGNL
jgi:cation diffusion facilitator family transporter